jgi:hypothetical protein
MNSSVEHAGMLLMVSGNAVDTSLILPVRRAFMFMTSWTIKAIARNSSGASNRRPVAHRLRHATSTAQRQETSSRMTLCNPAV